ncbi:MAG: shikimate kinase, partial [Vicinamibacteria bacterium]|nr:shikimate kinase [Vicinamibacteria bacterium]
MPALPERIVLVGFMGSGKSTIGPLLAGRLGWPFIDLDLWIERQQARAIAEIFAREGEAHFRALEQQAARAMLARDRLVIAAGGGAYAFAETRR